MPNGMANIINLIAFAISIAGAIYLFYTTLKRVTKELKKIMTEKKRASVYDPVAQKKWSDKNRAKKNVNTRRSNAKRFIREDATLEELDELQALIEERRETLDM